MVHKSLKIIFFKQISNLYFFIFSKKSSLIIKKNIRKMVKNIKFINNNLKNLKKLESIIQLFFVVIVFKNVILDPYNVQRFTFNVVGCYFCCIKFYECYFFCNFFNQNI